MPYSDKKTRLAWLGGFIDGEGCISLVMQKSTQKNGNIYYYITGFLRVSNTNRDLLLPLVEEWGCGHSLAKYRVRHETYKPIWVWTANAKNSLKALTEVLPYLRGKREQAKLVMMVAKINANRPKGGGGGMGNRKPEWKQWFEEMAVNKIRELNKRGNHAVQ